MPLSVVLLTSAPAWRGSGTSLAKIAAGLAKAGHRATVIAASDEIAGRFAGLGVPAIARPMGRTGWRELLAMGEALRLLESDVILCDTPRDLRLAALASTFRPRPIIFRYNLSRRVLPRDPLSRILFARVRAVVHQSEFARDRALRTSPWLRALRGSVIPNGYDPSLVQAPLGAAERFRDRHGPAPGRNLVVSGAALFLDKGYRSAFEALARVAAERPVDFVICGEGDDRAELVALARRTGCPARFAGLLPRDEWFGALRAADVVLHPTSGELFGNVMAEAMLLERPVVAVDSGASPEVVGRDGSAGLLVPEGDAGAMASAILALLGDADRRAEVGRAGRARVTREFPLEAMEQGYVRVVEQVAGAGSRLDEPPA